MHFYCCEDCREHLDLVGPVNPHASRCGRQYEKSDRHLISAIHSISQQASQLLGSGFHCAMHTINLKLLRFLHKPHTKASRTTIEFRSHHQRLSPRWGGGGSPIFFGICRLGSSIYPSPPKNIRNFKHPKKIFEILATQKISPFCTLTLKMHNDDP